MMPVDVSLDSADIELDEIQSDDLMAIVVDKVKRAYAVLEQPVIVEDVSAGLDKLKGLPGPFIKFFNANMGKDALYQLAGNKDGERAMVACSAAYYDGDSLVTMQAEVPGTVVSPRGGDAFGFDIVFMPDGFDQTYAEMGPEVKDSISHRSLAIAGLLAKLKDKSLI